MGRASDRINELYEQLKTHANRSTNPGALELQAIKQYLDEQVDGKVPDLPIVRVKKMESSG